MAEFQVRTKGGADAHGRARVYFCCHPKDFDRYFDKICEDIFKTHEPAIYYTRDMTEPLDETNISVDLARINLFVVPITFRLMNEPNRAMQVDIAYAKEHNITILPFMMESGIDVVYALPKNFGERQYISPFSSDITEISYKDKLKKFLENIFISDETAQRVRAAFDAYIFLSYRKKDRAYANELMRIIHNIPGCRDIAIWYDEFLTPGESFMKNIEKAMKQSKLFTLLVTPNLLEDGNFVMTEEYPAARQAEMAILPTEMEETDRGELGAKFDGIPDPIKANDEKFSEALLSVIRNIAILENDSDPEHNFLIGLAYLEGIDVEINVERGIELITKAAEAGLPEAMEKLYRMYQGGDKVQLNYREAQRWAKRLVDFGTEEYGEENEKTLSYLNQLGYISENLGEYQKALELNERVYELRCKILGEDHPDTLISLGNLAYTYEKLGDYKRGAELSEKAYELRRRILGEEHADTILSLNNLAGVLGKLGERQKSFELYKKTYESFCKIFGEEHPYTFRFLGNLATAYEKIGEHQKAVELFKKVYEPLCRTLGEEHPDTLLFLNNIGCAYVKLGESQKAVELLRKVYESRCKILGAEHPDTLNSLNNIAVAYGTLGDHRKELELNKKVYDLRLKILGAEHPDTLASLENLASGYGKLGERKNELDVLKRIYDIKCRIFGPEHRDTLISLSNLLYTLAHTYGKIGEHQKELEVLKNVYELRCRILGEEHAETLGPLGNLAYSYFKVGDNKKALELFKKLYVLQCKLLGISNPATIQTKKNVEYLLSLIKPN